MDHGVDVHQPDVRERNVQRLVHRGRETVQRQHAADVQWDRHVDRIDRVRQPGVLERRVQCSGSTPQTCDATGTWVSGTACVAPATCLAATAACVTCGDAAYGALVKSLGATSYWSMDETGTSFADSLGGLSATMSGTITKGTTGLLAGGSAAAFGGAGYARVPYTPSLNSGAFTWSAWVTVSGGAGTWRTIVSNRGTENTGDDCSGFALRANYLDQLELQIGQPGACSGANWGGASGGSVVPGASTYFVAGVYDGTAAASLYLNGQLVGSGSAVLNPNSEPLDIGQMANGLYKYQGTIDAIARFKRVLSAAEIAQLYATGGCH